MKATISITAEDADRYRVRVSDGTATEHVVTLTQADQERYAAEATPEKLLRRAFEFLLEREPKESILRKFALPEIERYFPDFAVWIRAESKE
jgi:hypothetical protein